MSRKKTCSEKFREACNFIGKETLAQVFSYEFCEISKKTFFTEHLWWLFFFPYDQKLLTEFSFFYFADILILRILKVSQSLVNISTLDVYFLKNVFKWPFVNLCIGTSALELELEMILQTPLFPVP